MFIVEPIMFIVEPIMINKENGAIVIKKKWSETYESS